MIDDIIEFVDNEDEEDVINFVDQEKAFDRMEWGWLNYVMDFFLFWTVFIIYKFYNIVNHIYIISYTS
jgi:hypothetical protein